MRREMRRAADPDRRGLDQRRPAELRRPRSRPGRASARRSSRDADQRAAFGGQRDWEVARRPATGSCMRPTQAGLDAAIDNAMDVAREVIDRRINALGTLEPTIIRQGSNRIVVQVPGLQDPEALKALIGRTARLEFKMVNENVTPEQLQAGPRAGRQPDPADRGRRPHRRPAPRDHHRRHDRRRPPGFRPDRTARPTSSCRFDTTGSQPLRPRHPGECRPAVRDHPRQCRHLRARRSASRSSAARPTISGGGFTVETANQLAISLRSGRLPVELHVVEERTVGPDLGRDSIRKGVIASIVATLVVILFMLITYGRFGVYATIGLILNALMILGIMAFFNATLTLPGIAGFVLTIGAAVDANVLINERIREEQRRGQAAARRARIGLSRSLDRDLRRQHHQRHRRRADVLFRLGPDPRLRGGADDRHRHLGVHRGQRHPDDGRPLGPPRAAQRTAYLRSRVESDMRLLKLVPDNTNIDFMRVAQHRARPVDPRSPRPRSPWSFTRGLNLGVDFVGGQMVRVTFVQPPPARRTARAGSTALGRRRSRACRSSARPTSSRSACRCPRAARKRRAAPRPRCATLITANYPGARIDAVETVSGKVSEELFRVGRAGGRARDARHRRLHLDTLRMAVRRRRAGHPVPRRLDDAGILLAHPARIQPQRHRRDPDHRRLSLNDTVVIYDRIRENLRKYRKMEIVPLLNLSLNETLSRTMVTSSSILLALLACC